MSEQDDNILQKDPFARMLGIELLEAADGRARAALDFRPELGNFAGLMHGGAVFGLADFAFSAASNSRGGLEVAINISINYLASPAAGERVLAVAEEVGGSRKLGHYHIEVETQSGKKCAIMHGVTYRMPTK